MEKQILGYYSHKRKIFKTEREKREQRFIENKFKGFIINPYSDLTAKNPFEWNVHFRAIDKMDFLIVSTLNGTVSRSSFYEVNQALERRIPVFEIQAVANTFIIKKVNKLIPVSNRNLSAFAKLVSRSLSMVELENNKYLK